MAEAAKECEVSQLAGARTRGDTDVWNYSPVIRLGMALLGALLPVLAIAPAAAKTDRVPDIAKQLESGRVLIDTPYGRGDTQRWVQRIKRVSKDVAQPVYVVMVYPVKGDGVPEDAEKFVRQLRAAGTGPGYYVIAADIGTSVVPSGVPQVDVSEVEIAAAEANTSSVEPLAVAKAWLAVRMLSSDPPPAGQLQNTIAQRPSFQQIDGSFPDFRSSEQRSVTTLSAITAGIVILIVVLVVIARLRKRSRSEAVAEPVDVFSVAELTDRNAVQRRLTELSTALSQETPSEDARYVRATRNAEAAARYADSERPRDRLGASLLAMAGADELAGRNPHRPCVFNPLHAADRVLSRTVDGVRLERAPCCAECLALVHAKQEPAVLRIPRTDDGDPVRFDTVDDVWTRTAYGAHSENLAEQALAASFEGLQP